MRKMRFKENKKPLPVAATIRAKWFCAAANDNQAPGNLESRTHEDSRRPVIEIEHLMDLIGRVAFVVLLTLVAVAPALSRWSFGGY